MTVKELIAKLQKFYNWKALKDGAPFPGPRSSVVPRPMMIERATGRSVPVPDIFRCAHCGRSLIGIHMNTRRTGATEMTMYCDDCESFIRPAYQEPQDAPKRTSHLIDRRDPQQVESLKELLSVETQSKIDRILAEQGVISPSPERRAQLSEPRMRLDEHETSCRTCEDAVETARRCATGAQLNDQWGYVVDVAIERLNQHADQCRQCSRARDPLPDYSRYCTSGRNLAGEYIVALGPPGD